MIKTLLIAAALMLTGCAGKHLGEPFNKQSIAQSANLATVVFYRPGQSVLVYDTGLTRMPIAVDGEPVTAVGQDTYAVVQMPPGEHQFNAKTKNIDTVEKVTLNPGQTHYFRVSNTGYSYWTYILIKEKTEAEAMPELLQCKEQINSEAWIKNVITTK